MGKSTANCLKLNPRLSIDRNVLLYPAGLIGTEAFARYLDRVVQQAGCIVYRLRLTPASSAAAAPLDRCSPWWHSAPASGRSQHPPTPRRTRRQNQEHIAFHQRRQTKGHPGGGGEGFRLHFLFRDTLLHDLVVTVLKTDLHRMIACGHTLDQRRKPADGNAADTPHRYDTGHTAAEVCRLLQQLLPRGQHGRHIGQQLSAVFRQADAHVQPL